MTIEQPRIEWSKKSGRQCLKFTFGENLTARDAATAIVKWKAAFESKKDEKKIVLVWDCVKMKEYESDARTQWVGALKEMKPRIDSIWLITDSVLIGMGASVMGMLSSINIKTVKSESEIIIV